MNRTAVESSNVESIGYDPGKQLLEVAFKNGGIYQYAKVPAEVHAKLMEPGQSVGKFLHAAIKPHFACAKVS